MAPKKKAASPAVTPSKRPRNGNDASAAAAASASPGTAASEATGGTAHDRELAALAAVNAPVWARFQMQLSEIKAHAVFADIDKVDPPELGEGSGMGMEPPPLHGGLVRHNDEALGHLQGGA